VPGVVGDVGTVAVSTVQPICSINASAMAGNGVPRSGTKPIISQAVPIAAPGGISGGSESAALMASALATSVMPTRTPPQTRTSPRD
jgi:hypothetical protein